MKTNIYSTRLFTMLILMVFLFPFTGFTQLTKTFQSNTPEFVPGTIVIKVKEGIGPYEKQERNLHFDVASLDEKVIKFDVTKLEKRFKHKPIPKNSGLPDLSRIYRIEFPESQNVHEVAQAFATDLNIEYAEPMPIGKFTEVPDDPMYSSQQHLPQIMAPEAWDIHKGEDGEEVIVAIVDTGADWLHPDLTENTWQNLGEDADGDGVTLEFNGGVWERDPDDLNGIDDDGNGFVDDLIGWDFFEFDQTGDGSNPDPTWNQGPFEHGTHCAGIAAGRTNNGVGISSVSYNVKYMPLQTDAGNNTVIYGFDGIVYAADNGADIISNSWGALGWYSEVGRETVEYATGLGSIVLCAAGNDNSGNLNFPSAYPGSISVAALNPDDTRASFSNFGPSVDIAAPGVSILSTITNNNYASWGGTSMATPMVAGLFGLLKSYQPDWTNDQLIEQVIGTADNIDDLNPGYEKALGSGRINAYRALVDENVEVPQEFRLEFLGFILEDEDGDGVIEAGETVSVSIIMRNFAHLVSDENAVFTLSSVDPDITVTTGTVTAAIPADSVYEINSAFQFEVATGSEPHIADFIIEVSSDLPLIYGSETEIAALVGPSGFFVWEGDPNKPDYSGAYIRDFLEARGHEVFYSNHYPNSFAGFDAVFLSFGNAGENIDQATFLEYPLTIPIQDYLENGGILFSEGSPFLGIPGYFNYPNADEFADLFGTASIGTNFNIPNPISKLVGLDGTLGEGMLFNESNQQYNWYIDKIFPDEGAITPFSELGYGNVSIYNEGDYGQRTFHFAYSLAELVDEDPHSSRYNILINILNFFGYPEGDGYVVANFSADQTEGEPDLEVQFTDWSITDDGAEITAWAWDFDEDGEPDSYDQNPLWTYSEGGVYDVTLVVYGDEDADTLVKKDFITVRSGVLVYEGDENANGYSGTFIRDYLEDHWYDNVGYTNNFPASLEGYDAVFLSFGNTGMRSTQLTYSMADAIKDYCLDGGNVYIEGGDALNSFNASSLWVLGLTDAENGAKNDIDDLIGQEDAITNGLEFNSTNQLSIRSIDTYSVYEAFPGSKEAFYESDYGLVAVEFDGTQVKGQKTFCMSYALADLEDGEGINTRYELLKRIIDFFDVTVSVEEQAIEQSMDKLKVYPNPATDQLTLEFTLEQKSAVVIEIFDLSGRKVSEMSNNLNEGIQRIDYNVNGYSSGVYYVKVQTGEKVETIKWVKAK